MTMDKKQMPPGTSVSRAVSSGEELPLFGTAAILAGGKSSRMGFDKQLLMEKDRRMLEQVIARLKEEFSDVLVVTSRPELYEGMGVRLTCDEYREKGPLAGLHAALQQSRSRYVYLLACDMPVVCLPFIRHMKDRIRQSGAEVCTCRRDGQLETFNTFYDRSLLPEVVRRLETGERSLFRFIHASRACVIEQEEAAVFDRELQMFTNINTPGEYETYLDRSAATSEDMALTETKNILRYIGGEYVPLQDLMVHEMALQLEIPGLLQQTLHCSPHQLRELVVGHLYNRGYIRKVEDIASLQLDENAGKAVVQLKNCEGKKPYNPLSDKLTFDPEILLANQQRFYDESTLQKATAGTHRCALCDDSGTHLACVDISRHNCMDKLAGQALLQGIRLEDKYILTSGRIPMDMVQKAAAMGVSMIVSRSTPTVAAVELGRRLNMTVLGFSRENRFNIYSAPQRLKGSPVAELK